MVTLSVTALMGMSSSTNRIVYIVGSIPLKTNPIKTAIESVTNQNSTLKCCYYIYQVNVSQDPDDYEKVDQTVSYLPINM